MCVYLQIDYFLKQTQTANEANTSLSVYLFISDKRTSNRNLRKFEVTLKRSLK